MAVGYLANYAANKMLDHMMGVASFTMPSHLYVALSTADPGNTGSTIAEPSTGSYARAACDSWLMTGVRTAYNSATVTFAQSTGIWGTITHFAIFDSLTGGNMIAYGPVDTATIVQSRDTASIASSEIILMCWEYVVSDLYAEKIMKHLFMIEAYTFPTSLYITLLTSEPSLDLTTWDEIAYTTRPSCIGAWGSASAGSITNPSTLTLAGGDSSGSNVTYAAICEGSTVDGLDAIMWAAIDTPAPITVVGSEFTANQLVFTME